jgi:hypothetical protein
MHEEEIFSDSETHAVRPAVCRLCQPVTQFVTTQDVFQAQTD